MTLMHRHIEQVRNRLMAQRLVNDLAMGMVIVTAILLLGVLGWLLTGWRPTAWGWWLVALTVLMTIGSLVRARLNRPDAHHAAVAIDQTLGLKEKYSTALYLDRQRDHFADAAVRDAQRTAEEISLSKRFQIAFPKPLAIAAAVGLLALLLMNMTPLDLLDRQHARQNKVLTLQQEEESKQIIQDALVKVQSIAQGSADDERIQNAQQELQALLAAPPPKPERAALSAMAALQQTQDAITERLNQNPEFLTAQQQQKRLAALKAASGDSGKLNEVRQNLATGNFDEAAANLDQAVDGFEPLSNEQKKQSIAQMHQLARQIAEIARPDTTRTQTENQLQRSGLNAEQSGKIADAMQRAADGDRAAQTQLKQQIDALPKAKEGTGSSARQTSALNQAVAEGQAAAQAQADAKHLAKSVEQLAEALTEKAETKTSPSQLQSDNKLKEVKESRIADAQKLVQSQLQKMQAKQDDLKKAEDKLQVASDAARKAQERANQPPAGEQKQASSESKSSAAQAAQSKPQDNAQQSKGQQAGNEARNSSNESTASPKANAQPGNQSKAQASPQSADNAQSAGSSSVGETGVPNPQQDATNQFSGDGEGGSGEGNGSMSKATQGAAGTGGGERGGKLAVPFSVNPELSASQENDQGQLLAASLLKDPNMLKGESRQTIKNIVTAAEAQAADEVQPERISNQARQAGRGYFDSLEDDAGQ